MSTHDDLFAAMRRAALAYGNHIHAMIGRDDLTLTIVSPNAYPRPSAGFCHTHFDTPDRTRVVLEQQGSVWLARAWRGDMDTVRATEDTPRAAVDAVIAMVDAA